MNKPITFAIVVPVYNVEKYLRECLESIRNQNHPHFEVFMVDDGSTDSSGRICDEYATMDARFHVMHKENEGVSAARNDALNTIVQSEQKYQYIAFVDSDDFVALDWLSEIVQVIQNDCFDYITFGYQSFFRVSDIQVKNSFKLLERSNEEIFEHYLKKEYKDELSVPILCNKIFSIKTLKNIRFDKSLKIGEDQDLFFQMKDCLTKGMYIYKTFYFYRQHTLSAVNTQQKRKIFFEVESHMAILHKYLQNDCIRDYMWRHLLCAYTFKFKKFGLLYPDLRSNTAGRENRIPVCWYCAPMRV